MKIKINGLGPVQGAEDTVEKASKVLPSLGVHSSKRYSQATSKQNHFKPLVAHDGAQRTWNRFGVYRKEEEGSALEGRQGARGSENNLFFVEPQFSILSDGHLGHTESSVCRALTEVRTS